MKKFDSEYQPENRRTRNKLTLALEAIRSECLIGTDPTSSKEETEKAVFAFMAKAAFNPTEDTAAMSTAAFNMLIKKMYPDSKATNDPINFKYNKTDTPAEKAESVMEAVAAGDIPTDIGSTLIGMIKDTIAITESTELIKRFEDIVESFEALKKSVGK